MSVIDRALKAAQREKSRLDAESGRQFAPVLVRIRTPRRQTPRRVYVLGGVGVVAVALAAGLWLRGAASDPLPDVPPLTSTILSEALTSRAPSTPEPRPATQPATRSVAAVDAIRPDTAAQEVVAGADAPTPPTPPTRDRIVIQRVEPAGPAARQAGTLRISVDPPAAVRNAGATALFEQAIAAHRSGNVAQARSLYERVLGITPNDADALNNLAVLLTADREPERALSLLRRAVAVAPANAGAWNNMGSVLRERGLRAEAIDAFRRALAIDQGHQGARIGLAQLFVASGEVTQARRLLEEALALNPRLAEGHYTLGQVLEAQGDRAGAIASYSAFIRHAPPRLAGHVELVRRHLDALADAR